MTLYRIRFNLCSAIVTPLKGDTIWGHIVWGIANHEGSKAVADFLEQEKSEKPALIVSGAFPAGMLCKPLPLPKDREGELDIDSYSEIKKDKKIKYESALKYFTNTKEPEKINDKYLESVQVMHNTIDRAVNTVLQGGLYSVEEIWSATNEWDIYVLSSFEASRIRTLLEWAFEYGYGADASTGKGKIIITGDPVEVKPKMQGNTYMALAPFATANSNIRNLRADIFVRSGKVGGAFATSLSPYKKPVVLYDEGAVFVSDKAIEHIGILFEKMHSTEEYNICQSGFAPVIPIE